MAQTGNHVFLSHQTYNKTTLNKMMLFEDLLYITQTSNSTNSKIHNSPQICFFHISHIFLSVMLHQDLSLDHCILLPAGLPPATLAPFNPLSTLSTAFQIQVLTVSFKALWDLLLPTSPDTCVCSLCCDQPFSFPQLLSFSSSSSHVHLQGSLPSSSSPEGMIPSHPKRET